MRPEYERRHPVTGNAYAPMETARFTEIPTFLRTPLARDLQGLDIALVGLEPSGLAGAAG